MEKFHGHMCLGEKKGRKVHEFINNITTAYNEKLATQHFNLIRQKHKKNFYFIKFIYFNITKQIYTNF